MTSDASAERDPIQVQVGSIGLRTPLIAASGTCGFGQELEEFGVLPALGAFVTKTVTREPREGNPPPRTRLQRRTACVLPEIRCSG